MKRISYIFILLAMCTLSAMAQPVINSASNAASYDAELARGSMVVLIGSGLGPSPIQVASSFPLSTSFAGASVQVMVNGVMTEGIMYYASDGQSAFVLDSDTPAGAGMLTLTYNGQTSAPFPVTVVDSKVGFYTLDSSGTGAGVVTFHESVNVPSPFASDTNAINPGDLVILWANGLGPVPFDETIGAESLDLTDVPLQLFVNGQEVETIYRGRSPVCCTSVDNIFFFWPEPSQAASIPALQAVNSCDSTISAQIGDKFSNLITVPSADIGSRTCQEVTDPGGGDAASPLDSILTQEQIDGFINAGNFSFGFVGLTRDTNYMREFDGSSVEQIEGGTGVFAEFNTDIPGALEGIDQFLGTETCTTSVTTSDLDIDFFGGVQFNTLNAGPGILVNGPNGQNALSRRSFAGLTAYIGEFPNGFLTQGTYSLDSSGGPDVGPFMTTAVISNPLEWTNREQLLTIVRSNGFTVTWTGPTSGWVTVSGETSGFNSSTFEFTVKSFSCTAPATQGSINVPGNIASFVDATNFPLFDQLQLDATQLLQFPVTNLDVAVFALIDGITQDVEFQ